MTYPQIWGELYGKGNSIYCFLHWKL
jgi:hypothetical protein